MKQAKVFVRRDGMQFVWGALFALGLGLAGLTSPAKVLGFLTLDDNWQPNLLVVMAVGIATFWIGYSLFHKFIDRRPVPKNHAPIERTLIVGSLLFGAGWGVAGYCPGPAVTVASFDSQIWPFLGAMTIGMSVAEMWKERGNA